MAGEEYPVKIPVTTPGAKEAEDQLKKVSDAATKLETSSGKLWDTSKELGDQFKELASGGEGAADAVMNIAKSAGEAIGPVAGATASIVAFAAALELAMISNANKMMEEADASDELAQKLMITTGELAAMKLAADENAGSAEGMQRVFDKAAKSMSKLDEENVKTEAALRKVGLTAQDMIGKTADQFALLVIQQVEASRGTEYYAGAVAGASVLISGAWRENSVAIKAFAKDHDEFVERTKGAVASDKLVELAGKQEKAMSDLKLKTDELRNTLAEYWAQDAIGWSTWAGSVVGSITTVIKSMHDYMAESPNMAAALNGFASIMKWSPIGAVSNAIYGKFGKQEPLDTSDLSDPGTGGWGEPVKKPFAPIKEPAKAGPTDPVIAILAGMNKEVALYNDKTAVAEIGWEIIYGKLKDATAEQKKQALLLADQKDTLSNQKALNEKIAQEEKKWTDERERASINQEKHTKQYISDLEKVADESRNAIDFLNKTTGMTKVEKELFAAMTKNAVEADAAIKKLDDKLEGHRDQVDRIRDAEEKANEAVKKASEDRQRYNDDWTNGMRDALAEYSDSAANAAEFTKNAFTNAFQSMEDALVNFAMTGKFTFGSFAQSILADLARIAAKSATSGIMNFLGKAIMGAIGGGGSALNTGVGSGFNSANWGMGLTGSANGNVFSNGNVQQFSLGGIPDIGNTPAAFAMANGGIGTLRENGGDEAIMPLSRGSDGKLGVRASGNQNAGVSVGQVNITVQGKTNDEQAASLNDQLIKTFQRIADSRIKEATRYGNMLNPRGA